MPKNKHTVTFFLEKDLLGFFLLKLCKRNLKHSEFLFVASCHRAAFPRKDKEVKNCLDLSPLSADSWSLPVGLLVYKNVFKYDFCILCFNALLSFPHHYPISPIIGCSFFHVYTKLTSFCLDCFLSTGKKILLVRFSV